MSENFIYYLVESKLTNLSNTDSKVPYSKSVHFDDSSDEAIIVKVITTIRFNGKESIYEYVYSVPYGQELVNILDAVPEIVHSTFGIHLGITIALYKFKLDFIPSFYQIKQDIDLNFFTYGK